tara:strand:- start:1501 stop:2820 length:1320 start_codon:yes stop_codon:yes gene_type:complete
VKKRIIDLAAMSSGRAAQAILSFVAVSILARIMGPENLGVYSVVLASYYYCLHISEFGLRAIVIREWNRGAIKGIDFLSNYFLIRGAISCLICILSYFICSVYFPEFIFLVPIIMASTIFNTFQVDWVLLVTERYLTSSWILVIRPAAYCLLLSLLYYYSSLTLATLSISFLCSWVLLTIGTWLVNKEVLIIKLSAISVKGITGLLKNGSPIFVVAIIGQAIQSIDLLYIGSIYGAKKAGFYYLCSAIIVAATIFANSMSQITLGKMSNYVNNLTIFRQVLLADFKLMLIIATILSLFIVGVVRPLIPILFGHEYTPSSLIILYFVPYFYIYHINSLLTSCYIVLNKQKELLVLNIARISLLLIGITLIASNNGDIHLIALLKGFIELILSIYILACRQKEFFTGLLKFFTVPALVLLAFSIYLIFYVEFESEMYVWLL